MLYIGNIQLSSLQKIKATTKEYDFQIPINLYIIVLKQKTPSTGKRVGVWHLCSVFTPTSF